MPRTARASVAYVVYHVLNRGIARNEVFHQDADYGTYLFLKMLNQANERANMRLLSFCQCPIISNWQRGHEKDGDPRSWMQWLLNSHVRRYHRHFTFSDMSGKEDIRDIPIAFDTIGAVPICNLYFRRGRFPFFC